MKVLLINIYISRVSTIGKCAYNMHFYWLIKLAMKNLFVLNESKLSYTRLFQTMLQNEED